MTRSVVALIFVLCYSISSTLAQIDSSKFAIRQARYDVRFFKLGKADYKLFLKNKRNSTSDYFKPIKTKSDNSKLLTDSVYVKEFRKRAYNKTRYRRLNNYMVVIGSVGVISWVALMISVVPTGK